MVEKTIVGDFDIFRVEAFLDCIRREKHPFLSFEALHMENYNCLAYRIWYDDESYFIVG